MASQPEQIIHDFGNGLVMRHGTHSDAQALATFNSQIHSDDQEPDLPVAAWTEDLLSGNHPIVKPDDFTVVIEAATGKIVSSLCLINQTWTYAGIPFGVGRPELVGTDPAYRNHGLVRAQFDMIHRWSMERGQMVQAITGIPYYYRQFGYEMALNLGGWRGAFSANIPQLKPGETEPFTFRPADETDLPAIQHLYNQGCRRSLVSCQWDETLFRYELLGKRPLNITRLGIAVIEAVDGKAVGFLGYAERTRGATFTLHRAELDQGISWWEAAPSILRYLWRKGKESDTATGKDLELLALCIGEQHPFYQAVPEYLPKVNPIYAYYLRLPDLAGFLRLIAPALEERLQRSPVCPGFSGSLKLDFYRSGLNMVFERGKLKSVEPWRFSRGDNGVAGFPGLTFLQVLFGYRSLEEIQQAFPDCWSTPRFRPVLNTLFPRQFSSVMPVS
ncbi:MAG TPA: GNAT family N-acetyltransferase [Anaerolineaceae bacterium]